MSLFTKRQNETNVNNNTLRPFQLDANIEYLRLKKESTLFLLHQNIIKINDLLNINLNILNQKADEYFESKVDKMIFLKDIENQFHFYQLVFKSAYTVKDVSQKYMNQKFGYISPR